MLSVDRLKTSLFALVRAAVPRFAYAAPRFAKVVKATTSSGATTLDVVPEDPDFPSMGKVPLFHGLPGVTLTLAKGTLVLVEFSEGDPAKAFVRSWAGGENVALMEVAADMLTLGGKGTADNAAKTIPVASYFAAIAVHVHPETGTTTGVSASLATPPTAVQIGATSVKVK